MAACIVAPKAIRLTHGPASSTASNKPLSETYSKDVLHTHKLTNLKNLASVSAIYHSSYEMTREIPSSPDDYTQKAHHPIISKDGSFSIVRVLQSSYASPYLQNLKCEMAIKVFRHNEDDNPTPAFLNELAVVTHCNAIVSNENQVDPRSYITIPLEVYSSYSAGSGSTFLVYERALCNLSNLEIRYTWNDNTKYRLAQEIVSALTYLHSMQVLHKDIKPDNILIYKKPTEDGLLRYTARICDFSASVVFPNHFNCSATFEMTTYHYRAPEQVFGVSHSYPADVWGLGCVLWHLYTNEDFIPFSQNENEKTDAQLLERLNPEMVKEFIRKLGNPIYSNWWDLMKSSWLPFLSSLNTTTTSPLKSTCSEGDITSLGQNNEVMGENNLFPKYICFPDQIKRLLKRIFVYNPKDRCTASEAKDIINSTPLTNSQSIKHDSLNNNQQFVSILKKRTRYPGRPSRLIIKDENGSHCCGIPRQNKIIRICNIAQSCKMNIQSLLYAIHLYDEVINKINLEEMVSVSKGFKKDKEELIIFGCITFGNNFHEMQSVPYDFFGNYGSVEDIIRIRHFILEVINYDLSFPTAYNYKHIIGPARKKDKLRWKLCKGIIILSYIDNTVFDTSLEDLVQYAWARSQNKSEQDELNKYSWANYF